MNARPLIARMERFPAALTALLSALPDEDWRWRPAEGGWSILEVVGHLLAEEREDFRVHLRMTLEEPERDWPPMDPEGAVRERRMNEADPQEVLAALHEEREASIAWLRSLVDPRWDRAHHHPKFPPIHAGDLLAAWAAHDARHLQQIAKRLHALAARDAGDYSVAYAG